MDSKRLFMPVPTSLDPYRGAIHTLDRHVRVFVSASIDELKPERVAASDAIRQLRQTPILFEELGARPYGAQPTYQALLDQSDVFLGIYGERYGWVGPNSSVSGVEDEYNRSDGKPRFIYIKDCGGSRDKELEDLLQRIKAAGHVKYKRFRTAEELRDLVAEDLAIYFAERLDTTSSQPSGTPTFLFTDIVGSTKRWEQYPALMAEAMERHFQILDRAIADHQGYRYKAIGDAVQASFHSPMDAVLAAVQAQRDLASEDWGAIESLRVRMAIHSGPARPQKGDYLAPSLNLLARVLSTGSGGQILITSVARGLLLPSLPAEIGLKDLGEYQLRDILEIQRIYQIVAPGIPHEFPPLQPAPPAWTRHADPIFGRGQDIDEIADLVRDRPIVALTGPAGVGKTRLAAAVSEKLVQDQGFRRAFVDLTAINDAAFVADEIAQQLHVSDVGSGETNVAAIAKQIGSDHILLVLDNFEHVLEAEDAISRIVDSCSNLRVLVTSRIPLANADVKVVWPLEVPEDSGAIDIDYLRDSPSVKLFVDRAERRGGAVAWDSATTTTVAAICRRLDGFPLAIQLAANWSRLLSPEEILAGLNPLYGRDAGGGLLVNPHVGFAPNERHRSMEAALTWSLKLLTPIQAWLLRVLSVFRGRFTFDSAAAVATAGYGRPIKDLRRELLHLEDGGFIQRVGIRNGRSIYSMPNVIREYAAELLAEDPPLAEKAQYEHANRYRLLALRDRTDGSRRHEHYWYLEVEFDSLRQSLDYFEKHDNVLSLLEMAAGLSFFWPSYGHLEEGLRRTKTAIQLGEARLERTSSRRAAGKGREPQRLRVALTEAVFNSVSLLRLADEIEEAERSLKRSESLAKGVNKEKGDLSYAGEYADLALERGQFEQARRFYLEAFESHKHHNCNVRRSAQVGLGHTALQLGDHGTAEAYFLETLELDREIGNLSGIAFLAEELGHLYVSQHRYEEADSHYQEALTIRRDAANRFREADILHMVAHLDERRGEFDAAERHMAESVEIFRGLGFAPGVSRSTSCLLSIKRNREDDELCGICCVPVQNPKQVGIGEEVLRH